MEEQHSSVQDAPLYLVLGIFGAFLIALSFVVRVTIPDSIWVDLLLNIGATLVSTAGVAFLYQKFGSRELFRQITAMRQSLVMAQRGLELGVLEMWRERRHIPNDMWNKFTADAQNEVWLFGIAELGFAQDPTFHRIVSEGTTRGCRYRFMILDPNSGAAEEIDFKEGGGQQVQGRIRRSLLQFEAMQRQNAGKRGTVEIRVYSDTPRVSIVRSDNELLVTPYMAYLEGKACFTLRVQSVPTGTFAQYVHHFEETWKQARSLNTEG
jgi:hypothetical protein